jgi:hypothetical protein
MLDLFVLAAETAHEEHDATLFYIAGGVLAAWAVLLAAIGLSRPDFPRSEGVSRGVMAISVILVIAAMGASVTAG